MTLPGIEPGASACKADVIHHVIHRYTMMSLKVIN